MSSKSNGLQEKNKIITLDLVEYPTGPTLFFHFWFAVLRFCLPLPEIQHSKLLSTVQICANNCLAVMQVVVLAG
jgi:hypothetical protein